MEMDVGRGLALKTVGKLSKTAIPQMELLVQETVTHHVVKEVAVMIRNVDHLVKLKEALRIVICVSINRIASIALITTVAFHIHVSNIVQIA